MHRYRSHTCGALRESDIGKVVRLSGWCHRIRDHGGVLFIDLRDHYGLTQVVADPDSKAFKLAETLRSEWVVRIDGKVRKRPAGTENPGAAHRAGRDLYRRNEVLGAAAELPMPVFGEQNYPEDVPLRYRFLEIHHEKSCIKTSCCAVNGVNSLPRADEGPGFFPVPDTILTA